jgi:hypothetical protein
LEALGRRIVTEAACPQSPRNDSRKLEPGEIADDDVLTRSPEPTAGSRGRRLFKNGGGED